MTIIETTATETVTPLPPLEALAESIQLLLRWVEADVVLSVYSPDSPHTDGIRLFVHGAPNHRTIVFRSGSFGVHRAHFHWDARNAQADAEHDAMKDARAEADERVAA